MEFSATLLQLSYVVIYLVNCLKLEKSCLKFHFHLCSSQKRFKKQFIGAEYIFSENSKIRNLRLQTSELQNIAFSLSQTCWDTLYK